MWNQEVRPVVSIKAPIAAVKGHGLYSTRWNGCRGVVLLFALFWGREFGFRVKRCWNIILFISKFFSWKENVMVLY